MLAALYRGTAVLVPVLALALLPWGWRLAIGVLAGGALGASGLLYFDRMLANAIAGGQGKRRAAVVLLLRYPALLTALGALVCLGLVNPVGLCVGVGVIPLVSTVLAVGELATGRHASE